VLNIKCNAAAVAACRHISNMAATADSFILHYLSL